MVKNRTASLPQSELFTRGQRSPSVFTPGISRFAPWVTYPCRFLPRFHGEGQPSAVRHPHLYLAACHDPQGPEGVCGAVQPSLCPRQRQVIKSPDCRNHYRRCKVHTALRYDFLCYSQLSESPETETDSLKVSSQSEELLTTPLSSTSTDSSFGEGMRSILKQV